MALRCRFSRLLERFIILADLWPTKPRSTFNPEFSLPYLLRSTRSDQLSVRRAACSSRRISPFSFSFWASSRRSRASFSRNHTEKFPWISSCPAGFRARMWSTHPSRKARSWETSRNPRRSPRRYRAVSARPASSRWLVGSSIMG